MVPDVTVYAPHIEAVFGRITRSAPRYIPYTVADQGQRGGAAGKHRQADRTGRQIGGDGGAGLTPRQHKTGEHHHERLQRDRHRRARNRNLAGGRGQPHQHGEQHRLPGCGDDTTGERCGGRSGCGGV